MQRATACISFNAPSTAGLLTDAARVTLYAAPAADVAAEATTARITVERQFNRYLFSAPSVQEPGCPPAGRSVGRPADSETASSSKTGFQASLPHT